MKPRTCPSCGGMEFIEHPDAYQCAYCDTRYPRAVPNIPEPVDPRPETYTPEQNTPFVYGKTAKNKWVALALCFFLGYLGAHKFYENRRGMGLLYLCTMGLFGYGWLIDCFILLFKPTTYYV